MATFILGAILGALAVIVYAVISEEKRRRSRWGEITREDDT